MERDPVLEERYASYVEKIIQDAINVSGKRARVTVYIDSNYRPRITVGGSEEFTSVADALDFVDDFLDLE